MNFIKVKKIKATLSNYKGKNICHIHDNVIMWIVSKKVQYFKNVLNINFLWAENHEYINMTHFRHILVILELIWMHSFKAWRARMWLAFTLTTYCLYSHGFTCCNLASFIFTQYLITSFTSFPHFSTLPFQLNQNWTDLFSPSCFTCQKWAHYRFTKFLNWNWLVCEICWIVYKHWLLLFWEVQKPLSCTPF